MKKLSIFAALAAMTLFASCSKDNSGDVKGGEGAETKMDLTIAFPKSTATRASLANATTDEMKVNDITLFLYGTDGEPAKGHMTAFDLTNDFVKTESVDKTKDIYTLKYEKRITTTTGLKSVYVGINMEGSKFMNDGDTEITVTSNEALLNEFYKTSVADLTDEDGGLPGDAFRMFSVDVENPTLVAETDPLWSTNNTVVVDVERQVAKMSADFAAGKTATTMTQWEKAPSVYYGTHTMQGYYLAQAGKEEMYRFPQYNLAGKQLTTTDLTGTGYTDRFKGVNANGTALNAAPALEPAADVRTSFFGIENVSLNNIKKETTVAIFHTTFVPAKATVWDSVEGNKIPGDPKPGWGEETWDGTKLDTSETVGELDTPVEEGSFWVVKHGDDYKFFYSQADSYQYALAFNLDGYTTPALKGGQCYQKGNSYFYAYLGGLVKGEYEFIRNQYYQLVVEGVKGLGYPGTLDPKKDPNDPYDPENPDTPSPEPGEPDPNVPDPEEPTPDNNDETSLLLQVVVREWDMKVMDAIVLE